VLDNCLRYSPNQLHFVFVNGSVKKKKIAVVKHKILEKCLGHSPNNLHFVFVAGAVKDSTLKNCLRNN
jgi:hypothetical protein